MHMLRAAIGLVSLAFALPAQGTSYAVSWQGIFESGTLMEDSSDLPVMVIDLAGMPFQITYLIDDSLGVNDVGTPGRAYLHDDFSDDQPGAINAWLTIGAREFIFPGFPSAYGGLTGEESVERFNYAPGEGPDSARLETNVSWDWEDNAGGSNQGEQSLTVFVREQDPDIYGTLFNSTAYDAVPARPLDSSDEVYVHIMHDEYFSYVDFDLSHSYHATIDAVARSASIVGTPEAVPEPASWGLMIMGFALVGFVQRRRRALPAEA